MSATTRSGTRARGGIVRGAVTLKIVKGDILSCLWGGVYGGGPQGLAEIPAWPSSIYCVSGEWTFKLPNPI